MPFQSEAATSILASTVARSGGAADAGEKQPTTTAKDTATRQPTRRSQGGEIERDIPVCPVTDELLAGRLRKDQVSLNVSCVISRRFGGNDA